MLEAQSTFYILHNPTIYSKILFKICTYLQENSKEETYIENSGSGTENLDQKWSKSEMDPVKSSDDGNAYVDEDNKNDIKSSIKSKVKSKSKPKKWSMDGFRWSQRVQ